jgi:anti-sigma B factor antagonist
MAELKPADGALEGPLTMAVDQVDGRAVVTLAGELDLSGTAHFESRLAPILDRGDLDEIVFDLAELGFIDSSGLAVLVKTAASGKRVILRRPSTLVREVVAITGLDGVLPVEP